MLQCKILIRLVARTHASNSAPHMRTSSADGRARGWLPCFSVKIENKAACKSSCIKFSTTHAHQQCRWKSQGVAGMLQCEDQSEAGCHSGDKLYQAVQCEDVSPRVERVDLFGRGKVSDDNHTCSWVGEKQVKMITCVLTNYLHVCQAILWEYLFKMVTCVSIDPM